MIVDLVTVKLLRASQFTHNVWLGLVTNGNTDASTFKYVDNSPFTNFSNFWLQYNSPDGRGFGSFDASVAFYRSDLGYVGDCESNQSFAIVCYKVFKFLLLQLVMMIL